MTFTPVLESEQYTVESSEQQNALNPENHFSPGPSSISPSGEGSVQQPDTSIQESKLDTEPVATSPNTDSSAELATGKDEETASVETIQKLLKQTDEKAIAKNIQQETHALDQFNQKEKSKEAPSAEEEEKKKEESKGEKEKKEEEKPKTTSELALDELSLALSSLQASGIRFKRSERKNKQKQAEENLKASIAARIVNEFIAASATKAQTVISMAKGANVPIMTSSFIAQENIKANTLLQIENIRKNTANQKKKATLDTWQTIGWVKSQYQNTVNNIEKRADEVKKKIEDDHNEIVGKIQEEESSYFSKLQELYSKKGKEAEERAKETSNFAVSEAAKAARAYRSRKIHRDDSLLDGPLTDNRMEARAKAAREVGKAYRDGLKEEAGKVRQDLEKAIDSDKAIVQKEITIKILEAADKIKETNLKSLETARKKALEFAGKTKKKAIRSATQTKQKLFQSLEVLEAKSISDIQANSAEKLKNLGQSTLQSLESLQMGIHSGLQGLLNTLQTITDQLEGAKAPDPKEFSTLINEAQTNVEGALENTLLSLNTGIANIQGSISNQEVNAGQILTGITQQNSEVISQIDQSNTEALKQQQQSAHKGFNMVRDNFQNQSKTISEATHKSLFDLPEQLRKYYNTAYQSSEKALNKNIEKIVNSFKGVVYKKMLGQNIDGTGIPEYADQSMSKGKAHGDLAKEAEKAAAKVEPRWKKVLKVLAIIIAIIVLVAVIILTGGAGLVGLMAIGALVGGVLSAGVAIGMNIATGRDPFDGVFEAFFKGAAIGAASAALTFGLATGVGAVMGTGATAGVTGLSGVAGFVVDVGIDVVTDLVIDIAAGNEITWTSVGLSVLFGVVGSGRKLFKGADVDDAVADTVKREIKEGVEEGIETEISKNVRDQVSESIEDSVKQQTKKKVKEGIENTVQKEIRKDASDAVAAQTKKQAKEQTEKTVKEETGEATERKAKEEAERKAKEEAERKAKEEAERKAKEEAERKAKEEAERKAKEEAERKAKEEAERKAKEEAERKAKEEAERKAKEEAEKQAKVASGVKDDPLEFAMNKRHNVLSSKQKDLVRRLNMDDDLGKGLANIGKREVTPSDLAALTKVSGKEHAIILTKEGQKILVNLGSYKGGTLPPMTNKLLMHSHPDDMGSGVAKFISKQDIEALELINQKYSYMVTVDGDVYRFTRNSAPDAVAELVRTLKYKGWVRPKL